MNYRFLYWICYTMEIEIKKTEDQSDFPLQTEEQYKEPSPTTSQF